METSLFGLSPETLSFALAGGAATAVLLVWIGLDNVMRTRHGFEQLPFAAVFATVLAASLVNGFIRNVWPLEPILGWPRTFAVYGLVFFTVKTVRWTIKHGSTPPAA